MTTATSLVTVNHTQPQTRKTAPSSELSLQQLGTIFAQSGFFNDAKSASQAVTKILAGRELGFGSVASMTGVYIVKGRVSLSANMMLAAILKSGKYKHKVVELGNTKASVTFYRRDDLTKQWEEIGTSTFTMEDAKQAGLANSQNYRAYPRNMLFARSVSNGCRWFCPDAFSGVTPYTPDEIDDSAKVNEEGEYEVAQETKKIDVEALIVSPATKQQVELLEELIQATKTDMSKLLAHYEVSSLKDLTAEVADSAITVLRSRLQK